MHLYLDYNQEPHHIKIKMNHQANLLGTYVQHDHVEKMLRSSMSLLQND